MSPYSNELLVDGYISRAFYPNRSAELYLSHLLKTSRNLKDLYQTLPAPGGSGLVFVIREASRPLRSPPLMWDSGAPLWLLDYVIKDIGTVVPQTLWIPHHRNDIRQHVEEADLQMPIFFIHENGDLGLSLEDAVNGRHSTLRDARTQAQLGGKTTTHIRISVSSSRPKRPRRTCIDSPVVARVRGFQAAGPDPRRDPCTQSNYCWEIRTACWPFSRRLPSRKFVRYIDRRPYLTVLNRSQRQRETWTNQTSAGGSSMAAGSTAPILGLLAPSTFLLVAGCQFFSSTFTLFSSLTATPPR